MDPIIPIPPTSSSPSFQPYSVFVPGIFDPVEEGHNYLASLDSDTRDYVIKHTDEYRTKADIIDCVKRLHEES